VGSVKILSHGLWFPLSCFNHFEMNDKINLKHFHTFSEPSLVGKPEPLKALIPHLVENHFNAETATTFHSKSHYIHLKTQKDKKLSEQRAF